MTELWPTGPHGRLTMIARAHQKMVLESGVTDGKCWECDRLWPCPTWRWATDSSLTPGDDPWHTIAYGDAVYAAAKERAALKAAARSNSDV